MLAPGFGFNDCFARRNESPGFLTEMEDRCEREFVARCCEEVVRIGWLTRLLGILVIALASPLFELVLVLECSVGRLVFKFMV